MGKGEGKKARQTRETEALSPLYLEHVKMTSFGRFANLIVGPFGPGMNVVLGPNEAGKTTINELVKAVLFGWPTGRKAGSNSYRPEAADRAGSLFSITPKPTRSPRSRGPRPSTSLRFPRRCSPISTRTRTRRCSRSRATS